MPGKAEIHRIGMCKTAAIGDTILITGIVKDIAEAYPHAELVFFAASSNIATARLWMPERVKTVLIPIKSPFESVKIIRAFSFDVFIDFGPWPRIDALLALSARSRFTIGFNNPGQHRHYGFDAWAEHDSTKHEYYNYKALVKLAGVEGNNLPVIRFGQPVMKGKYIVMHLFPGGSKAALREWLDDRWLALAKYYIDLGYTVYLTGAGKANEEKIAYLQAQNNNNPFLQGFTGKSLEETALLLAGSKLVFSVDTGIMHMASAIGCNLVSFHGPTPAFRWGPLNTNSIKLEPGPNCKRCGNLGFEDCTKNRQCINDITLEMAISAGNSFLSKNISDTPEIPT